MTGSPTSTRAWRRPGDGAPGGFLAVSAVSVTSGPDTALTIRNSLASGRQAGMCTGAGVSSGQVIWAVTASAGVASLLAASRPAFVALRIAGAAYLVFLGARSAVAAARRRLSGIHAGGWRPGRIRSALAFRPGAFQQPGQPEDGRVLRQPAAPVRRPGPPAVMLVLGLVFAAMTLAWLAGYTAVTAQAGQHFQKPGYRQAVSAISRARGARHRHLVIRNRLVTTPGRRSPRPGRL